MVPGLQVGEVDHHSRLYTFSHFVPKYDYVTLITHENEESREKSDDKFEEGPLHALQEEPVAPFLPLPKEDLRDDFTHSSDQIYDQISEYDLEYHQNPIADPNHKLGRAHHTLQTTSELVGETTKSQRPSYQFVCHSTNLLQHLIRAIVLW
jgi:hypothetical protein